MTGHVDRAPGKRRAVVRPASESAPAASRPPCVPRAARLRPARCTAAGPPRPPAPCPARSSDRDLEPPSLLVETRSRRACGRFELTGHGRHVPRVARVDKAGSQRLHRGLLARAGREDNHLVALRASRAGSRQPNPHKTADAHAWDVRGMLECSLELSNTHHGLGELDGHVAEAAEADDARGAGGTLGLGAVVDERRVGCDACRREETCNLSMKA